MNDLGINRITPSMLVQYENCPKAFYYKIFLGLKIPTPEIHLNFGTAIHSALDHIYFLRPVWGDPDPQYFQQVLDELQSKFKPEHVDDKEYTSAERLNAYAAWIADGSEMLKQYWDQKEILWADGVQPAKMEVVVKMELKHPETGEVLEVPVSCRIDGEAENGDVVEFKTSGKKYDNFETHGSNQGRMYVWVQWCRTGRIPDVHYVVLLKKRKRDKIQHLPLCYDKNDLVAFDQKVRGILNKIRNREFNRPVHNHPPYCDCFKYERLLNPQ